MQPSLAASLAAPPLAVVRSRWRPAALHLGGSALAGIAAALLVMRWYPAPFALLTGGYVLLGMMIAIDVVLGPTLTAIVATPGKALRVLARDIAVIVLVQLGALAYGLQTAWLARPVALAFEGNRFRVVAAADVVESELRLAPPDLRRLSTQGPVPIATAQPTDPNERMEAIQMALAGADIGVRPKYWRVWDDGARRAALAKAQPVAPRVGSDPALAAALRKLGRDAGGLVWLPLLARRDGWVVLLDAGRGDIVGYAPVAGS